MLHSASEESLLRYGNGPSSTFLLLKLALVYGLFPTPSNHEVFWNSSGINNIGKLAFFLYLKESVVLSFFLRKIL